MAIAIRIYRGIMLDADKRLIDAAIVTALCHELDTLRTQLADAQAELLVFRANSIPS